MRYPNPINFYIQLGNRIRAIRLQQKLSQSELGYRAELDKSVIQRLEMARTNATIKTLLKIANAFDITLSELCDIEAIENKK
ncbi:helix-turn-helix transcriptional regulator [Aquimarina sp. 2201CG1-2-11]|uniref:helix-turn-helix domain-containing protein n=1 Tax=Aquimarina discodermiae TaxID=3231043 RepID=UPI003461FFCF